MAEHEPEHRCKASNARGEPCKATIIGPDGFCPAHAGGGRDMRAIGKLGGRARSRKQPEQAGDRLERIAHAAIEELLQGSSATARAAAARLVVDKMVVNSPLNAELARRAAYEAMQQQMRASMPAVREKLTVLIERRAHALAQDMYRARIKLETEAVKAEMTTGASRESAGEDAPLRSRVEEASFVIDEAARLWKASGLVPEDVDERAVLRGLYEIGLIAPGRRWEAKAEEETEEEPPATDEIETTPPPSVDVEAMLEESRRQKERERLARKFGPPPESDDLPPES